MNIEFYWNPQPIAWRQEVIERKISEDLRDIKPCHPDRIIVSLGISGPLDTILQGSAKCKCGKTLMVFKGGDMASDLEWTEYKLD